MIFSIIILVAIGAIVFFHYLQGFFSATLSALLTIVAAGVALSYHEVLVESLLGGKYADQAGGMAICVLFAAAYLIPRVLFDKLIPGYVQVPVLLDRIGGAAMGVVAAVMATGVVAIAAQSMPFDKSLAGYTRYPLAADRQVVVPSETPGGRQRDSLVYDQMTPNKMDTAQSGLLLPVDDLVLSFVSRMSEGAMSGHQPLRAIHPDYLQELWGQRAGAQVGAKRTALNLADKEQVTVLSIYQVGGVPQGSPDFKDIHSFEAEAKHRGPLLVVRAAFNKDAADADDLVRVGTGAVRLVVNGKNLFPIGTLDNGSFLWLNKPDDPLFVDTKGKSQAAADFVFDPADSGDALTLSSAAPAAAARPAAGARGAAAAAGGPAMPDGTFFEAKRYGRVALGGKVIEQAYPPTDALAVLRKPDVAKGKVPGAPAGGGTTPTAGQSPAAPGTTPPGAPAGGSAPLTVSDAALSDELPAKVNATAGGGGVAAVTVPGGGGQVNAGGFTSLQIDPIVATTDLAAGGGNVVGTFAVQPGKQLVQIVTDVAPGADPWAWAVAIGQFGLSTGGGSVAPIGYWAEVKTADGRDAVAARYDSTGRALSAPPTEGRPVRVRLLFAIGESDDPKAVTFAGTELKRLAT